MSQNKTDQTAQSSSLRENNHDELISRLMKKEPRYIVISLEDYQFAKQVIESYQLKGLRPDNFCIDLTKPGLIDSWTMEQYAAVAKLIAKDSKLAAILLKEKQEQKLDVPHDKQLLWVRLPEQTKSNKKAVNEIIRELRNHGYQDRTGNEAGTTLLNYINSKKPNPIVRFTRVTQSVSVVIVVKTADGDKVLLLKRVGLGGRVGWGTLTGIKEENEAKENTVLREVHEEINCILKDKIAHYVGSAHTPDLAKDLFMKGKTVSYADDCSYVYGIRLSEEELKNTIKLDDENSAWKLFSREELIAQFKVHKPEIHGEDFNSEELHIALVKSLEVLYWAENDFKNVQELKFNFPYTNSAGFFAGHKGSKQIKQDENVTPLQSDSEAKYAM